MTPRAFQILQQLLITAVTVVLALVIFAAFLRILRPPDPETIARAAQARTTTTSIAPFPGAPPPTTLAGEVVAAPETPDEAVAPPCREDAPEAGAGTVLRVFYTCGSSTVPTASSFVYRVVPNTDLVLTNTFQELVKGPDEAEKELGFVSFFSSGTADALAALDLAGGEATIDFTGLEGINNLSTATGAQFFVANLNANVFQFDTIDAVEYRLDGSCDAFWALMEGECRVVTRSDWERQVAEWRAQG